MHPTRPSAAPKGKMTVVVAGGERPRNPFAVLARKRRAAVHGRSGKAERAAGERALRAALASGG